MQNINLWDKGKTWGDGRENTGDQKNREDRLKSSRTLLDRVNKTPNFEGKKPGFVQKKPRLQRKRGLLHGKLEEERVWRKFQHSREGT